MMHFKIGDIEYHLGFVYSNKTTIAILSEKIHGYIDGQQVDEWIQVATGEVTCNHKDTFSKYKGRRESLSKLMKENRDILNTKEIRKYVWQKYHEKSPIVQNIYRTIKIRKDANTLSFTG